MIRPVQVVAPPPSPSPSAAAAEEIAQKSTSSSLNAIYST
jgi:hypothetical protein